MSENDRTKIGYARVSTDDQNPDLQLDALKKAGCQKIYVDKASGAKQQRPELNKCLAALDADDVLIVWKLDRLGRSLHDLIGFLDDLKERKIQFQSLTESIDTKTPTGRAMWQMIGILAELERSLIQERTKAGRAAAQARGVKMGRKPKLTPQQIKHAQKLIEEGESPAHVAKLLNVARSTLYLSLSLQEKRGVKGFRHPSFCQLRIKVGKTVMACLIRRHDVCAWLLAIAHCAGTVLCRIGNRARPTRSSSPNLAGWGEAPRKSSPSSMPWWKNRSA